MGIMQEKSDLRNKKLNKLELLKNNKTAEEAFAELLEYAKDGYDSIPQEEKEFFFKCFGIYDKKATPNQFMLRIRVPGGQLTDVQADCIGKVARDYGKDHLDITTRMQIELRYLRIEDIPDILKKLKSSGLSTYQTGIDNFRNIVNDPLDGMALDNIIASQPILENIQRLFIDKEEWIGTLPRKFNIGILGSVSNRCSIYGQDCSFVLAQKNGLFGFNVYLGGKVGASAKDANTFVKHTEVERFILSLANVYKRYGFRDNRNKNRLFFFLQEIGMENVIEAVKIDACHDFDTGGITYVNMEQNDPAFGKIVLKDGTFALHMIVPAGIFTGSDMIECAKVAKERGNSMIRLTSEQKLYILGIPGSDINSILDLELFSKYKNISNPYFNNIVACAGTEHCSFGVIPNKPDAIEMAGFLSKEAPLDNGKIRMYWSGCPKGCGIHGFGDIGFEGCKAKEKGEPVSGVNISLGGKITNEGKEAKQLLKAIPLSLAKNMVKELVMVYKKLKRHNESFEMFDTRVLSNYSVGALGFLMRFNYVCEKMLIDCKLDIVAEPTSGKNETFEIFGFGEQLYRKITGFRAYDSVNNFRPLLKQKLLPPSKIVDDFPKELDEIIFKMIHPASEKAYQVFSELIIDLENLT